MKDYYKIRIKDNYYEAKDLLEALVEDNDLPPSTSAWVFMVGKYYLRMFKKHETPTSDLIKLIDCSVYVLGKVLNKELTFDIKNETGTSILRGHTSVE